MPDDDRADRTVAAVDLLGRAAAGQVEVGYFGGDTLPLPDTTDPPVVAAILTQLPAGIGEGTWWAKARWGGQMLSVEDRADPTDALEALASRALEGGSCVHCRGRVTLMEEIPGRTNGKSESATAAPAAWPFGDSRPPPVCRWRRERARWVRGCEGEADAGHSTKRRLAQELMRVGAPRAMIDNALGGIYDDFESPVAFNIQLLIEHCDKAGLHDLAERAKAGEFDSTLEESEAWMKGPEGAAAMAELAQGSRQQRVQVEPRPNRAARRAAKRRGKRD